MSLGSYPNLFHKTRAQCILIPQVIAAASTVTYEATKFDSIGANGEALLLLYSGAGGTGNTCNVTIEEADDASFAVNLAAVATFTEVGDAISLQQKSFVFGNVRRYLRCKSVTAGTTITFEIAVFIVAGGYSDIVSGGKTF